jgi:putative RecB family exonuclease
MLEAKPRSVSQFKEYTECPYRYRLKRIDKEWERPAAWFPQGLAVHEAVEAYERSERTMSLDEVQDVYRASYQKHTNRMCAETPNFDYWFRSGPYRGKEDVERRYKLGLEQVERYLAYCAGKGLKEVIWITPDGTPAIELAVSGMFGNVEVRGYLDQANQYPKGEIRIRDVKSGNSPGDDFQLAVYARQLEMRYDITVRRGDYWMGRTGGPTVPFDLSEWTYERLTDVFGEMDEGVRSERFDPAPEPSKCRFCSVSSSCEFKAE